MKSNFKYIAALNYEYLGLDLGIDEKLYDEQIKVDFEKQYMQTSRFNLVKCDVGI